MEDVSMAEPIIEFKNQEELDGSLREWQERLFLTDWTIETRFEDGTLHDEDGAELSGQNRLDMTNKCCVISLVKLDDDKRSRIQKLSQEHVLVHELLHCKYAWLAPPSSMEGKYFDTLEHGLLEQMSKSLIMAKYNLPFSWFRNF
jgi:hypothetical protein